MLAERENAIFSEWKSSLPQEQRDNFIPDGIVDEEKWSEAKLKILYLLKEVNGGADWDEREYLAGYNTVQEFINTHSPSIDALITWTYGLTSGNVDEPWSQVLSATADKTIQSALLSKIGVVNFKKVSGFGVADSKSLDTFATEPSNQEMLRRQLALYHPDIVICGGTAYYLEALYREDFAAEKWRTTSRGVRYAKRENTTYIDFCHPLIRAPRNMIYYSLLDAVKEIKSLDEHV